MGTLITEFADPLCQAEAPSSSPLADLVRAGLSTIPKSLPPWLFYDEVGSRLFEEITRLPEYYLTRLERSILQAHAGAMLEAAAGDCTLRLLELGSGSADKTRTLLAAALARQGTVCYQPIDVSESALEAARVRLGEELPAVTVEPLVADYLHGLDLVPCATGERRLALFIGSSIGNFSPEDALRLLKGLHAALEPGDGLLLGVDLAPSRHANAGGKTEQALIAAYDDAKGITAAFNRNLLVRLNRELQAEFDLDAFQHRIRWNREHSRIEMHLESRHDQTASILALQTGFHFGRGETIHTESSYKYRQGEAEALLQAAGFTPKLCWSDAEEWFSVHLAERA